MHTRGGKIETGGQGGNTKPFVSSFPLVRVKRRSPLRYSAERGVDDLNLASETMAAISLSEEVFGGDSCPL